MTMVDIKPYGVLAPAEWFAVFLAFLKLRKLLLISDMADF
jgi:hypothetical protein